MSRNEEMRVIKLKTEEFTCWSTLFAVGLPIVSIAGASIALALAILGFLILKVQQRNFPVRFPPIKAPLGLFIGTTLLALVFSPEPWLGRPPISKFWLFAIIPLVCSFFSQEVVFRAYRFLFVLGLVASSRSIYQSIQFSYGRSKITGFMGHWMTFSGELMLVFVTLVVYLYFLRPKRILLWSVIACVIAVALGLTFTRSVWIATVVGLFCILLMDRLNWKVLLVMTSIFVILMASPGPIQRRFMSIWDRSDPSNYARLAIWKAGVKMIGAHPFSGVGPQRVSKVFYDYHDHPEDRTRDGFFPVHMHNNILQFAAERGIPCALAWLWFMLKIGSDHWKGFRRETTSLQQKTISAAGFVAVLTLFVAGQFEFNFGDSEVLMVFLFLVTSPYVLNPKEEVVRIDASTAIRQEV